MVGSGVGVGKWSFVIGNWGGGGDGVGLAEVVEDVGEVGEVDGGLVVEELLPEVQFGADWPKLLRMVERSVRSTWPFEIGTSPRRWG